MEDNNYNDGDMILDLKFNEVFEYKNSRDKYAIDHRPNDFRIATQKEIDKN